MNNTTSVLLPNKVSHRLQCNELGFSTYITTTTIPCVGSLATTKRKTDSQEMLFGRDCKEQNDSGTEPPELLRCLPPCLSLLTFDSLVYKADKKESSTKTDSSQHEEEAIADASHVTKEE